MNQGGGQNKTLVWLIVILIIVILGGGLYYYLAIYRPTTQTTSPTPTAKTSTLTWQTYTITPGAEEAAEGTSAVKFSINYPLAWQYRVLDEEIKAGGGAGNNLHFVAFSDQTPITVETAKVNVSADSHKFSEASQAVLYAQDATQTPVIVSGLNAIKFVGKKAGMSGLDTKDSIAYVIETSSSWILIVEGPKTEEAIINQMVQTIKF